MKKIAFHNEISEDEDFISRDRYWDINLELYRWQNECLEKWLVDNNGRGIIHVITGAGKTVLALKAISLITDKGDNTNIRTLIVVPTINLMFQWREELYL